MYCTLILQPRLQAPHDRTHLTNEQFYEGMVNLISRFTLPHIIYPTCEFFDNDGTMVGKDDLPWWPGPRIEQPPNKKQGCGTIV